MRRTIVPTYTTATQIVLGDVSDTGPDFVTSIYSAAFTVAHVAQAFDNDEAVNITGVRFGSGPLPDRDKMRPMIVQCYGAESDPATHEARDMYSPELVELFTAVDDGTISPEDLVFTAKVVERYLNLAIRHHGDI